MVSPNPVRRNKPLFVVPLFTNETLLLPEGVIVIAATNFPETLDQLASLFDALIFH